MISEGLLWALVSVKRCSSVHLPVDRGLPLPVGDPVGKPTHPLLTIKLDLFKVFLFVCFSGDD